MLSLKMGNDNDFTIYVLMLAKKIIVKHIQTGLAVGFTVHAAPYLVLHNFHHRHSFKFF